ncbi:MAG: hypothetical protein HZY74_00825 [Brevundimonas sp.]|nr:MAG: hypothetical protein HZY74_00825 [Brevundimonas sp.]
MLMLAMAKGRVLCGLELMCKSRYWQGEKLCEPFPSDAKPGSIVLGEAAVKQGTFPGPVIVIAAESKTQIRIVLDDGPASRFVALSNDCVARIGNGYLRGFDIRNFTRK